MTNYSTLQNHGNFGIYCGFFANDRVTGELAYFSDIAEMLNGDAFNLGVEYAASRHGHASL